MAKAYSFNHFNPGTGRDHVVYPPPYEDPILLSLGIPTINQAVFTSNVGDFFAAGEWVPKHTVRINLTDEHRFVVNGSYATWLVYSADLRFTRLPD